ncbi:MAG: CAP domain-containing protein [Candidatus Woesearchaeota archaeon]
MTHHFYKRNPDSFFKKYGLTLLILSISFIIIGISIYPNINNKTVSQQIPEEISISNYVQNKSLYHGKEVSVIGYLNYKFIGERDTGYYSERLIDDFGNELKLKKIDSEYKSLFPKNRISEEIYNVTGIYVRDYEISILNVKQILPIEKKTKLSNKIIPAKINLKDYNLDNFITKISNLSSPLLNRLNSTIPSQPIQPVEILKECPVGYVNHWGECVQTCTDGTIYGHCSASEPYYCYEGSLIKRVSECGCPWGQYAFEEECMEKERVIEKQILLYTNYERRTRGLSELRWNDQIATIARAHSTDMALNHFFSHINLNGEDPSSRAIKGGFYARKQLGGGWYTEGLAENIGKMPTGNVEGIGYVGWDPESIAKASVQMWMDSPGHRENILNPQYSDLGVGVAYDGEYISTQNFW